MLRAADEHKLLPVEAFPPRGVKQPPILDSASFKALRELLAIAPIAESEMNEFGVMSDRLVQIIWDGHTLYD